MKFAQRFGRDVEALALLAALSRAVGLWDPSAASPATPPGSLAMHELTQALFTTWRRGGAWDEARPEREVLRVPEGSRDASPIGALREMVIDALTDLGEGRWVPWHSLEGYLAADERVEGIERLLRRWAERGAVEPPDVLATTRRIALETLPALGIIDLGGSAEEIAAGGPTVRLTPRGRALLSGSKTTIDPTPSKFIDTQALRVGPSAKIAHVLALAPFSELGRVGDQLDLLVTPQAMARALSAGLDGDALRTRIELVAPLPDTISRMLDPGERGGRAAARSWPPPASSGSTMSRCASCSGRAGPRPSSSSTPRRREASSSRPRSTSSASSAAAAASASRSRSSRACCARAPTRRRCPAASRRRPAR